MAQNYGGHNTHHSMNKIRHGGISATKPDKVKISKVEEKKYRKCRILDINDDEAVLVAKPKRHRYE